MLRVYGNLILIILQLRVGKNDGLRNLEQDSSQEGKVDLKDN